MPWCKIQIVMQPDNSQSSDPVITNRLSQTWDALYRKGRYHVERALDFTDDILKELHANQDMVNGCGLYVGCGNGRNHSKLAESGLNITGLDVSRVALAELSKRLPRYTDMLQQCDFLDYSQDELFQYIIAIQVFQHGNMDRVNRYFEKTSMLLERDGLVFLRVNASNTAIQYDHDIIEENDTGGFTVHCKEGPKKGLDIHFFSKEEICSMVYKNDMIIVGELRNVTTKRVPPRAGSWSQWELVARKN